MKIWCAIKVPKKLYLSFVEYGIWVYVRIDFLSSFYTILLVPQSFGFNVHQLNSIIVLCVFVFFLGFFSKEN